jgi:hypothetical protein
MIKTRHHLIPTLLIVHYFLPLYTTSGPEDRTTNLELDSEQTSPRPKYVESYRRTIKPSLKKTGPSPNNLDSQGDVDENREDRETALIVKHVFPAESINVRIQRDGSADTNASSDTVYAVRTPRLSISPRRGVNIYHNMS